MPGALNAVIKVKLKIFCHTHTELTHNCDTSRTWAQQWCIVVTTPQQHTSLC